MAASGKFVSVETMLEAVNWSARLTELTRSAGVPGAARNDDEPWTPVSFGELADRTPYLFLGGRVTPRVA
jgi:hypothetical protein